MCDLLRLVFSTSGSNTPLQYGSLLKIHNMENQHLMGWDECEMRTRKREKRPNSELIRLVLPKLS